MTGSVSASAYMGSDGLPHAGLEVQADDVEFLTPRGEQGDPGAFAPAAPAAPRASGAAVGSAPQGGGFVQVDEEDLPF